MLPFIEGQQIQSKKGFEDMVPADRFKLQAPFIF